ncbi:MAG: nucleotidyl transferase AbiEii/AbiGii toxin family protein [Pseudomonadota bacterium]
MNEAVSRMLARYGCRRAVDDPRAMREILQGIALLGLWRGRFFERAALCGGAALRLIHGLDRFEEDLDFTLLAPAPGFDFGRYGEALAREIRSLGFRIRMTRRPSHTASPLQSAFMKADTPQYQLEMEAVPEVPWQRITDPPIRIRIEIDTDPPPGMATESRILPLPIPVSVRTPAPPDLLAVKLAALLNRRYYRRAKGRDWYDLAWCAANLPRVNLAHLEARLRQGRRMPEDERLTEEGLLKMAEKVVKILDVDEARREVLPYLKDPRPLTAWSPEFFRDAFRRLAAAGEEGA